MKKFNSDKIHNENKQMRSVCSIACTPKNEKKHGKHPTQKPMKLLKRIILSSTSKNDLILDPFCGSGTTGVIALKYSRNFIGIDINKEYLELIEKRIKNKK